MTVNRSFVTRKPPGGAGPGSLSKRRDRLDKLLADVAAANAAQSLRPLETALDPTHVD